MSRTDLVAVMTWLLVSCHVERPAHDVLADAAIPDAEAPHVAMVDGVECADFQEPPPVWGCIERTLDEQCDALRESGSECPRSIAEAQQQKCEQTPWWPKAELVCNTCGGINFVQRYGFHGESTTYSFSAREALIGLILVTSGSSIRCMSSRVIIGEPCPSAVHLDSPVKPSDCPNPQR